MKQEVIRLSSEYSIQAAAARVRALPKQEPDIEWEMVLRPYRSSKTGKQLATLYMWLREASDTHVNEYAGHSVDSWKRVFKIHHYLPTLLTRAAEDGDVEFQDLVERWRDIYTHARPQDQPYIKRVLADNDALSLAKAHRHDLSEAMNSFLEWCLERGIMLTQPEKEQQ